MQDTAMRDAIELMRQYGEGVRRAEAEALARRIAAAHEETITQQWALIGEWPPLPEARRTSADYFGRSVEDAVRAMYREAPQWRAPVHWLDVCELLRRIDVWCDLQDHDMKALIEIALDDDRFEAETRAVRESEG